jgi:hypothetical protein
MRGAAITLEDQSKVSIFVILAEKSASRGRQVPERPAALRGGERRSRRSAPASSARPGLIRLQYRGYARLSYVDSPRVAALESIHSKGNRRCGGVALFRPPRGQSLLHAATACAVERVVTQFALMRCTTLTANRQTPDVH